MNKTYRIILLLLSFLMVAPFSGCAANHKVSTSNVLKTTIAQSSSVNVEITQQELKTEKQIFLNKVERLENSKDVTKMEVEIGEDQIRVTDQSIIQKWIRYLARLELQEVTEAKRKPIIFDEDAPELSPAMYKAFKSSVIRRNRKKKA